MERQLVLEGGLMVCDLGGLRPGGGGQTLECNLRLTEVDPDRRVAVAVTVAERSPDGAEHPRGTQMFTVPPHTGDGPRDIMLKGIQFFLPEDLDESGGGPRRLTVRAGAHYVDANERCLLPGYA